MWCIDKEGNKWYEIYEGHSITEENYDMGDEYTCNANMVTEYELNLRGITFTDEM